VRDGQVYLYTSSPLPSNSAFREIPVLRGKESASLACPYFVLRVRLLKL